MVLKTSEKLAIGLLTVLLLKVIASTIVIYFGMILLVYLETDLLVFASIYYQVFPISLLAIGIATLVTTVYGFIATLTQRKTCLCVYAAFGVILTIGNIVSIVMAFELRTTLISDGFSKLNVASLLHNYTDPLASTKQVWDRIQSSYRCCGGLTYTIGYKVWSSVPEFNANLSVPDSCCVRPREGCGLGILDLPEASINERIFVHGCLRIIEDLYMANLAPVLFIYAFAGSGLAVVIIMGIVLTAANVAQIKREDLEEEMNERLDSRLKAAELAARVKKVPALTNSHYVSLADIKTRKKAAKAERRPHPTTGTLIL